MAVFAIADNIYSPLGTTTDENFQQMLAGRSGIQFHQRPAIHKLGFYASLIENVPEIDRNSFTKFERMLIFSIKDALSQCQANIGAADTAVIISTTKGNISLLETDNSISTEQLSLTESAKKIAKYFGNSNPPIIVSNACISGLTALITAKRMLTAGMYKTVVVAGSDVISSFVFSGFNAFQAISNQPCKPYDAARNGVTLGEAAGTIILTTEKPPDGIELSGGGASNDANHISGPSRTGAELNMAIQNALLEANLSSSEIDFISAHGTATIYNDEMESKAITLASLQNAPVNSLKGYFGHTLGAAGIIESAIVINSLKTNTILPTMGYDNLGVPMPINVVKNSLELPLKHCLKTASGFGGCNAAVIWSKTDKQ
jgi:3-oxoacyl-[acyl-carrier-protein] synthase-1